jgi:hypothetical protein
LNKIIKDKAEAGQDILAYCGKCKTDTEHVVSAMEKDEISKVMCRACDAQHNYRKPKSQATAKKAPKATKSPKPAASRKAQTSPAKKWAELTAHYDPNSVQDYSLKQNFENAAIISHPAYGVGVVTKKVDQTKIEVQFEDGVRLLAINY